MVQGTPKPPALADLERHPHGVNLWCAACRRGAHLTQQRLSEIAAGLPFGAGGNDLAAVLACSTCGSKRPQIQLASPDVKSPRRGG